MADEWTGLDMADDATGALRDHAPDPLGVPDPDAPVSGHHPAPESSGVPASDAPEHEWSAARSLVFPIVRAAGTIGPQRIRRSTCCARARPLTPPRSWLRARRAGRLVHAGRWRLRRPHQRGAPALRGVDAAELAAAAGANLAAWSAMRRGRARMAMAAS